MPYLIRFTSMDLKTGTNALCILIMEECSDVFTPQPDREAAFSNHGIRPQAPVFSIGLSAYGVPNHTYWFVALFILPCLYNLLTLVFAGNIMLGINDDSVFTNFEEKELQHPVPRKMVVIDGRIIYMSRDLRMPKYLGTPVLCDFGSAMLGDQYHSEFIQPNIYRAPEVILGVPWTYSVDIWNVGCMIWDIYEGGSLFTGQDPEFHKYRSRAHLAEMINLLGPPPPSLLAQGELRDKFFSDKGKSRSFPNSLTIYDFLGDFRTEILLKDQVPLEERENNIDEEQERKAFLPLMRKMLQWEPSKRSSAKELSEDEWILKHL
ncbi:protein kinase [Penicillium riverlandense]|uniref:protein kinase n=1 Tax=Penicillium riverlandense TaxID=1903569 RepID=UPI0025479605|nr:protein kinase [Penicillium riverlandense]KAJ5832974.1 protein kinase [Penicillium riverlandense]